MEKHLEIKTIKHKDVSVTVAIDYDNATVSLVNVPSINFSSNHSPLTLEPKKWIFANRGVDYMNGWLNILEAMTFAVKECKKELEHKLAEDSKFKDDIIVKAKKSRK